MMDILVNVDLQEIKMSNSDIMGQPNICPVCEQLLKDSDWQMKTSIGNKNVWIHNHCKVKAREMNRNATD